MQTNFLGMNESQAVEHALKMVGFEKVESHELFVIHEGDIGQFTVPFKVATSFDSVARFLGKSYFDRNVIPVRRKRFLAFSQMLIECCAQWNDEQALEAIRSGT